jgi:hypothetical protein
LKAQAIRTAVSRTAGDDSVRSIMHNIGFMASNCQRYLSLGLRIALEVTRVDDLNQSYSVILSKSTYGNYFE